MDKFLPFLFDLAKKAFDNGDIPVSSIIIKDNEVFAYGFNDRSSSSRIIGHAEVNAILMAEDKIKDFRLNGYYMITTLKPCSMCYEIIEASRIDKVYYILDQESEKSYPQDKYIQLYFPGNNYVEKYRELFISFFKIIR